MSMPPTESTLDCSTYKSERKEFHETKLKRLPAPYDVLGQSCATVCQGAGLAKNEELDYEPEPATSGSQYCTPGSGVANMGTQFAVMMISNRWIPPPPFTQPLSRSSTDYSTSHGLANHSTNSDPVLSTRTSVDTPITSGPVSLIETSANPDQPPELDSPPPTLKHITNSLSDTISPLVSTRAEMNSEDTTYEYENSEDVVSVIRRQPVLDKTAESNALPFVLQGYARWINRLALDPLKMTDIARDFVFGQFQDGDQSRWVIALLANIGSRIGSVDLAEGKHNHMLSVLQTAVRRRIGAVNSLHNPERAVLAKALDCVVETMVVQFYISPVSEAITLRQDAAPIFRQLCSKPPGAPINLTSLLQHPLVCLWHYAEIDIMFSVISDMNTLFQYEADIPGISSNPYQSVPEIRSDGIIQWLHGIPNQIVLLFAQMKSIRQAELGPNRETVASLEQEICALQSFDGSSSERFLAIIRFVVQECWRQAAYIYLYMAVCGDPSNSPRVKDAFKRYMKLLNGIKPGRLPDEFLILTLKLIAAAAEQPRDREVIEQRALRLYTRDRTHLATTFIISVISDVWARADAERRPVLWSDIAVSRRQVLGV